MSLKPRNRKDWIIVALAKAGEGGLTAVQLQKVLFLLAKRRPAAVGDSFYAFEAYNYGPFSREVYSDADGMTEGGLVELDGSRGRSRRTYHLTDAGRARAEQLEKELPPEGVQYLAETVAWAKRLSFDELVRAVYEAYPEMRENSVFKS
jgi:uncharacterized protein